MMSRISSITEPLSFSCAATSGHGANAARTRNAAKRSNACFMIITPCATIDPGWRHTRSRNFLVDRPDRTRGQLCPDLVRDGTDDGLRRNVNGAKRLRLFHYGPASASEGSATSLSLTRLLHGARI